MTMTFGPVPIPIVHPTEFVGTLPIQEWGELVEYATWIVFECQVGSQVLWAWGRAGGGAPGIDGPRFLETYYTTPDGRDTPDIESAPTQLGRFLFMVKLPVLGEDGL